MRWTQPLYVFLWSLTALQMSYMDNLVHQPSLSFSSWTPQHLCWGMQQHCWRSDAGYHFFLNREIIVNINSTQQYNYCLKAAGEGLLYFAGTIVDRIRYMQKIKKFNWLSVVNRDFTDFSKHYTNGTYVAMIAHYDPSVLRWYSSSPLS